MDNKPNIHSWIKEVKALNRYSYEFLGKLISYTDVGFSKALKNETLSFEQAKLIAEKLELLDKFNSYMNTAPRKENVDFKDFDLSQVSNQSLALEVLKRWLDIRDMPEMQAVLEAHHELRLAKEMRNILSSKENYLKWKNS